jgi:hypothetical protein
MKNINENDFAISMFGYLQCLGYVIVVWIISFICVYFEKYSYGYKLLFMIFVAFPSFVVGIVYYFRYLYIHILLCRIYYAVKNKHRFYLLVFFLILFIFPLTAIIYAPLSPFIVYFLASITDENKVKQILNLDSSNDFYQFGKLNKAILEQLKNST